MTSLFKAPKPPKPVLMPDPDDKRIKIGYAKEYAAARQKSGRVSTQLADDYSGTTTGAP